MTRVRVPGKLMLAGEYAALAPGARAVALAVGRHLEVTTAPAPWPELASPAIGLTDWPLFEERPTGDRVVDAVLSVARAFLRAEGRALARRRYVVRSELSGLGHPKPGLGSSAAASVGLMAAFLAAAGLAVADDTDAADAAGRTRVRGLALLAHLMAQGFRGSGYDVATCAVGGLVVVETTSEAPLARTAHDDVQAGARVPELAARLAAAQSVVRHAAPPGVVVGLVATGRAARTPTLVDRARTSDAAPLAAASDAVVDALGDGVGDAGRFLAAIDAAQAAFEAWDLANGLDLMTPDLTTLAAEARAAGLVPRVSGAGGGDSLVVLSVDPVALGDRIDRWRAAGRQAEVVVVDERGLLVDPTPASRKGPDTDGDERTIG